MVLWKFRKDIGGPFIRRYVLKLVIINRILALNFIKSSIKFIWDSAKVVHKNSYLNLFKNLFASTFPAKY